MHTELRTEVSMLSFSRSMRALLVLAMVTAGAAAAQPANDDCANALSLGAVPGSGAALSSTLVSGLDQAVAGVEEAMSCGGTAQTRSVWFSFSVPATGTYRVASCPGTNFDSVLQVYSGACGALVPLTGGCDDDSCGSVAGPSVADLSLARSTTYFVQVAAFDGATVISPASRAGLSVSFVAADACDGPVTALSLNTPLEFRTDGLTLNDSQVGGVLDGGAGTCFTGLGHGTTATINTAPGRDVVFSFTPATAGAYNLRLSAPSVSVNTVLYLTDSCVAASTPPQLYAPPQCIAASNRTTASTTANEELVCVPLTDGVSYFLWADEGAQSTGGASYELEVTTCNLEVEANDSVATAAPLACPITGRAGTTTDVDFFNLGTHPVGSRAFATLEAQSSYNSGSTASDYDLRVTTASDTLEYDTSDSDTKFGFSAGSIAGTPLPNVPTYLRVNYNTAAAREPYRLHAVVQAGTATAEAEPNDATGTANAGPSNYFSGDVPATTDVDLFAFEARAGALVFLSLDSTPSRAGTAANLTLQLLDSGGAPLVAVNDANTSVNTTITTGTLTATTPASPSEALVFRTRTAGTYYARVGRSTTSTATGAYLLSIATDCSPGGGIGTPTLTSVTPVTGSVLGGTTVTLSGAAFSSAATVSIGGTPATVISRSATSLEVLTPSGNEGAVDVVVTNPGAQSATLTGAFTYFAPIAPPSITSVTPSSGPTAGGTVITVVGSLFKAGAEVTLSVGGTPVAATNVTIVSATQLLATTPAHAPGLATLTVRNPVDALEGSLADVFTYLAPPAVTSVTPATGFTAGGLTVTLTGTAFRPAAVVRFGANAGTDVVVDPGGTSLTVTTPPSTIDGPVDVTVINSDTQQTVVTAGFTYNFNAPTITSVTPAEGLSAGGTAITIVGTGFLPSPTVTIGGAPALSVSRTSLTQLTAVTPPGMAGPADVTVTNSDAQAATLTAGFRYVPPPTLTAVAPANGPVQGGTLITLTGRDFLPGATVRLGGVPAFAVTVTSPTTATAVTNSSAPGTVEVQLVNPDTQSSTLAAAFTYDPAPTLLSLSPVVGSTAGGTTVTLTGTGFLTGAAVLFGTRPATDVTVVSSTELTVSTPARPVGVVSVTVRNPDAQSAELPRAFRFITPPTVTAATPNTGDVAGGTVVRLSGSGFAAGSTVSFGGTAAAQVSVVSATELDAVTPPHLPGAVDVEVSTDGASATLTGGFTFTRGAPTLSAVAPPSGPVAGGTLLTLSGTGFAPGASVTVGGAAASDVVIVSSVLARAVVPAHAAGPVDVVLTNDDSKAATLAGGFTYVSPPDDDTGAVTDGGTGSIGEAPTGGGGGTGGVSCGCSSFDASTFSLAGLGLLLALSRRRQRNR